MRGYHATEPYAKAMRKRRVWVEPLFAEAKAWHGLRRFRLRGLTKVNAEALLIAAGQNLKRLLSRGGWGRRPWPNGAAGLALPAPAPHPSPFFNRLGRFRDAAPPLPVASVGDYAAVAEPDSESTSCYLVHRTGFETLGR